MGEMNLQKNLQPQGGHNRERKPSERGTASYAGRSSMAAGNQAALLTGSICDITGNQQILQLYPQGTYGNKDNERKRLAASHNGADTSGTCFEIEHAIGFAAVNPTEMKRENLTAYESALFAYAEIYLAHRVHIGTGRASNYTMPGILKMPKEIMEMQPSMQQFNSVLENFIQSNSQKFVEVAQLAISAYLEKLGETREKKNKKTFMEFLPYYLDHWVSFIQDLGMTFLGQFDDQSKSDILKNGWADFVKDRCLNQLLSELQLGLRFRRSAKFPYTMMLDRGFESDKDYREHQKAAVYEEQHIGNAVQLNQLGYAQIYDYILRRNPETFTELQIANDSFLYMVEHMLSVEVIDTQGKPDSQTDMPPDKITTKDQILYKTIFVTPEERCEMILARLSMVHKHWPGVLEEALVRFYIIGEYKDPLVRKMVLDTLDKGVVYPEKPRELLEVLLKYFTNSPLYIRILQDFYTRRIDTTTDVEILCNLFYKIPEMPVSEKLDTMSVLIAKLSSENDDVKKMCNELFGDVSQHLLLQALGICQPVLEDLENVAVIIKGNSKFSAGDQWSWFKRYLKITSFDFCREALRSAKDFKLNDFWGAVVERLLSFSECDDVQTLTELLAIICENQLLWNQLEAVLKKIQDLTDVDEDAMDELWQCIAPLLNDLNSALAEFPSIKPIINKLYLLMVNESESDSNQDGYPRQQERWQMLGIGQELNGVLSDDPQLIVDAITALVVSQRTVFLPALLNQLKDAELMAQVCWIALGCTEAMEEQERKNAVWLINNLFIRLEELGTREKIGLNMLIDLLSETPLDMHDALLAITSCIVAQVKMEPSDDIIEVAYIFVEITENSTLTENPEMLNNFARLIEIGSRMENPKVYGELVEILLEGGEWYDALIDGDAKSVVNLMVSYIAVDMPWAHRLLSLAISSCQDIDMLGALIVSDEEFGRYWDDIIGAFVRHPLASELADQKDEDLLQYIEAAEIKANGREKIMHGLRQLAERYGDV